MPFRISAIFATLAVALALPSADLAQGDENATPRYPWYIYNPRSCTGPVGDRAAPLLAEANQCEVRRAGWAHLIAPWATPTNTCNYTGYFVGGGGGHLCGVGGACSHNRGTWGWDFQGSCIPRVVRLAWTRPRRYQGGTGQYKPDGPRFPHKTPEQLFAPR